MPAGSPTSGSTRERKLGLRQIDTATNSAIASRGPRPAKRRSSARADATAASLFAFAVSILAARPMLRSLTSVPFTQNRDAAAAIDLGVLFAAGLLLGGLGAAFGAFLSPSARWFAALAALAAAGIVLRRRPAAEIALAPEDVPGAAADLAAKPQVEAEARDEEPSAKPEAPTLGRELRAIGVLYVAVCVLPALVGTMFAS